MKGFYSDTEGKSISFFIHSFPILTAIVVLVSKLCFQQLLTCMRSWTKNLPILCSFKTKIHNGIQKNFGASCLLQLISSKITKILHCELLLRSNKRITLPSPPSLCDKNKSFQMLSRSAQRSCFPSQSTKPPRCQCRSLTIFHSECLYTSDLCFSVAVSLFTSFFIYLNNSVFYMTAAPYAPF